MADSRTEARRVGVPALIGDIKTVHSSGWLGALKFYKRFFNKVLLK